MKKRSDYQGTILGVSVLLNLAFIFMLAIQNSNLLNEYLIVEPVALSSEQAPVIVEVYNEPQEIVEPVIVNERDQIDSYISKISLEYNIDEKLIHSIVWHESRYDSGAANGNCLGLMQVCTTWHTQRAERLGVKDFFDPYGNLLLGIDYLSELMKANDNDVGLVLMLYNMNHKEAFELHSKGELSWYATSVLKRVEELRQGVN